jgi:hypothetical protein
MRKTAAAAPPGVANHYHLISLHSRPIAARRTPRGTGGAAGLSRAATGGAGVATTKRGLRGGRGLGSSRPGSRRGADRGERRRRGESGSGGRGGGGEQHVRTAEARGQMSAAGGDFVACAAAGT